MEGISSISTVQNLEIAGSNYNNALIFGEHFDIILWHESVWRRHPLSLH